MNALHFLRRILNNRSGVAMTEFALGAPFLLTAGLWGAEEANYALVNMKIGQLAVQVADNASRVGDTSTLQNRKIYESDINDVIYGAQIQGGPAMGLYDNGRVIISSLEVKDAAAGGSGEQYIHWQRCRGAKNVASGFGDAGDVLADGMGPAGEEVIAQDGDAVIFVEINYTYQPLISARFLGSLDIHSIASFTVRDDRDLSQIYQRDTADPDPVQQCATYSGNVTLSTDGSYVAAAPTSSSSSSSSSSSTTSGGSTTSSGGSTTSSTSTTSGGSTTTTTTTSGGRGGGGRGGGGGGRGGGGRRP